MIGLNLNIDVHKVYEVLKNTFGKKYNAIEHKNEPQKGEIDKKDEEFRRVTRVKFERKSSKLEIVVGDEKKITYKE